MKFLTVEVFGVIVTCICILLIADGQNNAMGRHFLLHFACADIDPEVILYTYMRRPFRVTITVHQEFGNKVWHVTIRNRELGKFVVRTSHVMWQKGSLRTPVILQGHALFGVMVQTKTGMVSDSFMALPVESYGHTYLATNFGGLPFIILLSSMDGTVISMDPVHQSSDNISVCYSGIQVSFLQKVSLNRHQSFTMMECQDAENATDLLTGTVLRSTNPFGVISGGCWSLPEENEIVCAETNYEMALPAASHGKEFVVPDLTITSNARQDIIVVPHEVETTVWVFSSEGTQTYTSAQDIQGSFFRIPFSGTQFVKTDQKVTVFYVISTNCNGTDVYSPQASVTVLPTSLYFNTYHWSTLSSTRTETMLKALFIVPQGGERDLQVDGAFLENRVQWDDVFGDGGWKIGGLDITSSGFHSASNTFNFGAYAFSSLNDNIGMNPIGLFLSYLKCVNTVHIMLAGDMINNDCDNTTDEEYDNNLDDDNDGLIDEDLGTKIPIEVAAGCPPFRFGPNCTKICPNCLEACDKTTGLCKACAAGFAFGDGSCVEECPKLTFGFECTGSCMQKCNQDCLDRIYGSCSRVSETNIGSTAGSVFAAVSLFFTGIAFVCVIFTCGEKERDVPPPREAVSELSTTSPDV